MTGVQTCALPISLCWNSYRHLELYFAVPCSGMVLHTLNLRLHPKQVLALKTRATEMLYGGAAGSSPPQHGRRAARQVLSRARSIPPR